MTMRKRTIAGILMFLSLCLWLTVGAGRSEDAADKSPTAAEILEQWRLQHADRDWVAEEQERHTIVPPADNAHVLKGKQHGTYSNFTEKDIEMWKRELEKFVAQGSIIFHNAKLLGSSIAVSCDMCHPDAANTHPETYPKFQVQTGRVVLLRDMINWCVEQAVKGKPMEADDLRMRALEAYIYAQRKGTPLMYGKH
jgi:thiosulfate dehydrogenase